MVEPRYKRVSFSVPSSSANLGPGFDVHSIALERPRIAVSLEPASGTDIRVINTGTYGHAVSSNPQEHSGAKALRKLFDDFGVRQGAILTNTVEIPPRKGLGLSGAEAVGAIRCADTLNELELPREQIAKYASYGEPVRHVDNVSASLNGGFNIVLPPPEGGEPFMYTLEAPQDLGLVIIVPDVEKTSTEEARKSLPPSVLRERYVEMISRISLISVGFSLKKVDLILQNVAWDRVVEPSRADAGVYGKLDSKMLEEEKKMLYENFHVSETVSGAGPSRVLWYGVSKNDSAARGVRPIDRAIRIVSERLVKAGHKVVKIFETVPSRVGAQLIGLQ